MGVLDSVVADESPVSVTINFADYVDGEKLSTLARKYFAERGEELGAKNLEEYFAGLLLIKLSETLVKEANAALEAANAAKHEEYKQYLANFDAEVDVVRQEFAGKVALAKELTLVKK